VPKDNIERAIARGSGAAADGESFEHITYEGYGPAGVALLVEALTDNRNRTASDVRHVFAKSEGSLGESGSVAWLFERTGLLLVSADGVDEDELTLAAADGGADDVSQDGSMFEITCPAESVGDVRKALEQAGFTAESAQITMLPKTSVTVEDEAAARRIVRLMDDLEELDDVQDVYANFDIPEQVLEEVAN
jgi:YebC/PmpR family DNA-binding regulatory protein